MRNYFLIILFLLATSLTSFAQRFAYVNTDYILSNIPEFTTAQKQIDKFSEDWRTDISKKQKEVDDLYKTFQNEQYLLTEEQKKSRIQDIEMKEKAIKDFQKDKFGYEGELFKKRQELIKPIQDDVYDAIEKLAKARGYDFIFDKSNSTTMLYANPENDRSDEILKSMGITPGQQVKDKSTDVNKTKTTDPNKTTDPTKTSDPNYNDPNNTDVNKKNTDSNIK